jgi:4'-phosphopantetheinyl transferase
VHIWLADLNQSNADWLEQTLSPGERERANRFRFPHLRRNYVIRQGILRDLLGRYTGTTGAAVRFTYGHAGKPALAANPSLKFNMSQSQHLALYGFILEHDIGVDIECERPLDDLEDVARYYFAAEEMASLFSLSADQRVTASIKCWSRKEAFIKAVGEGLRYPLDAFAVTLTPDIPARLLRVDAQPEAVERWRYATFDVPGEYAAAAIVTHPQWRLEQWQWTDWQGK